MQNAGLSNFYASRADYAKYRKAPKLGDYFNLATGQVLVSAYWMAQGVEMEGVVGEIEKLMRGPNQVSFSIIIIDPTAGYIDALARHLDVERGYLISRVQGTLSSLRDLHSRLSPDEQLRLQILVHRTVPMASLVALDLEAENGRIQIDIKPYRTARQDSISFEVSGRNRHLYEILRTSTKRLVADAMPFDPVKHL